MSTEHINTKPLIEVLIATFKCNRSALQDKLNHPLALNKVLSIIRGNQLQTIYKDRNGRKKEVKCSWLSIKPASSQPAYEGYLNSQ